MQSKWGISYSLIKKKNTRFRIEQFEERVVVEEGNYK